MSDDDIQSVMVFVDALCRARSDMKNCEHQGDWLRAKQEADQARRNLIARLKEVQ
jgi:hypothetical protein